MRLSRRNHPIDRRDGISNRDRIERHAKNRRGNRRALAVTKPRGIGARRLFSIALIRKRSDRTRRKAHLQLPFVFPKPHVPTQREMRPKVNRATPFPTPNLLPRTAICHWTFVRAI